MSTESKKVWVVGHKNPDTDSICAAISYAYLKNQSGDKKTYVAKRAGAVNEETRYVLERFGVEEPPLVAMPVHRSRISISARRPVSAIRFR